MPGAVMEKSIRERSGNVSSSDPVVSFLYVLMRDYVPTADVEEIMQKIAGCSKEETQFSNGWLAQYAEDVASRLKVR
jgi:hypothetical protein